MSNPINRIGELSSSFRDPSGFLFYQDGQIFRQVNKSYQSDYDLLLSSKLYQKLTDNNLLIPHQEINDKINVASEKCYKIIQPTKIPFISYPYEWSFSQLKDAAILTLKIQKIAIEHKMSLKDASAYNVQFYQGKPIFIDTLSFESLMTDRPWVAYRQFCQHFLASLALMSRTDIRLNKLAGIFIDGVPLDLASRLLPIKTKFNFSLFSHLHLHATSQRHFADKKINQSRIKISQLALFSLIDNLESTINKLYWRPTGTEWADYYNNTNYPSASMKEKSALIEKLILKLKPKTVWDLGANDGRFSRICAHQGIFSIAFDIDPSAVEQNYRIVKKEKETDILPLVSDLANPSPSIGWANEERDSLIKRGPADCALALALIHHLAISNNLPFAKIAKFFAQICRQLIIEFVPKKDSQVQRLLQNREDIFPNYRQDVFEREFAEFFQLDEQIRIKNTQRTLYLMIKK